MGRYVQLTEEQKEWIGNRLTENQNGKVLVSSSCIKKYREFTGDYESDNSFIRSHIIDQCY